VSYDSSSDRHLASEYLTQDAALTECCRLGVVWEQVLVNPETKADVWVHDEIEDCTARYMCVLVDVALAICNLCNSTHWIYDDTLDAVRCTWMNVDEHE